MKKYLIVKFFALSLIIWIAGGCSSPVNNAEEKTNTDTVTASDTISNAQITETDSAGITIIKETKQEQPKVLIYSFHLTNRCPSCIAIENATKKTLDTYFANEVKQGRIKLSVLNVNDEANSEISEKYQAFGSGLYVTRVFKGKETTTDLTGDGFKFAKNKEERFIEILKNKIDEYLK